MHALNTRATADERADRPHVVSSAASFSRHSVDLRARCYDPESSGEPNGSPFVLSERCIDAARGIVVLLGTSTGASMTPDMGTFRVTIEIENPARPGQRRMLSSVLVDTGAELSWVPAEVLESLGVERNNQWRFRQANGTVLERWTGIVVITVAGKRTGDDVVFGEPGDLTLLGSRTLEGLNFRVEPVTKQLVDARPAPAAVLVSPTI